ncbi:MAG: hypothetical protein AAF355_06735 [Myxococcota bacterium]
MERTTMPPEVCTQTVGYNNSLSRWINTPMETSMADIADQLNAHYPLSDTETINQAEIASLGIVGNDVIACRSARDGSLVGPLYMRERLPKRQEEFVLNTMLRLAEPWSSS